MFELSHYVRLTTERAGREQALTLLVDGEVHRIFAGERDGHYAATEVLRVASTLREDGDVLIVVEGGAFGREGRASIACVVPKAVAPLTPSAADRGTIYRGPLAGSPGLPCRSDAPRATARRRSFRPWRCLERAGLGLASLLAIFVVGAAVAYGGNREHRALTATPQEPRRELYDETRRYAEAVCARARTEAELAHRCTEARSFLASFPECDESCHALGHRHRRGLSR
jgi:hypothetical protein